MNLNLNVGDLEDDSFMGCEDPDLLITLIRAFIATDIISASFRSKVFLAGGYLGGGNGAAKDLIVDDAVHMAKRIIKRCEED